MRLRTESTQLHQKCSWSCLLFGKLPLASGWRRISKSLERPFALLVHQMCCDRRQEQQAQMTWGLLLQGSMLHMTAQVSLLGCGRD